MRLVASAALVLVAMGAGACSGSGDDDATNSGPSPSSASLVASSVAAVHRAGTFHVAGSTAGVGGALPKAFRISADVDIARELASGTVTVAGRPITFVRSGPRIYVKAPAAVYLALGVRTDELGPVADRWMRFPVRYPLFRQLAPYVDIDRLFDLRGDVTTGPETVVAGMSVIPVTSSGGTVYIRSSAPPYPVKLSGAGSLKLGLRFSRFGAPVHARVPQHSASIGVL